MQAFLAKTNDNVHLVLIGDEEKIKADLISIQHSCQINYSIVHAAQVIEMHEHPTKALKEKQQSSIAIGFHLLATGKTDAFISAGNTGAMMVGACSASKPLKAFCGQPLALICHGKTARLACLVDVGLNADCKPENLNQFAVLGSLFAKHILNVDEPKSWTGKSWRRRRQRKYSCTGCLSLA